MEKRDLSGDNKPINFKLRPGKDDDIRQALDVAVSRDRCDRSDVIRAALRAYLIGGAAPPVPVERPTVTVEKPQVVKRTYGQDAGQARPPRKEPDPLPRSLIAGVGQNTAITESVAVNRMVKKSTGGMDADVDNLLGKF
jgi:hypothetical protein